MQAKAETDFEIPLVLHSKFPRGRFCRPIHRDISKSDSSRFDSKYSVILVCCFLDPKVLFRVEIANGVSLQLFLNCSRSCHMSHQISEQHHRID
jgi:hypothetical protein